MSRKTLKRSHDTLSQQITSILRQEILTELRPGQRLPAIQRLAERFEVCFNTVREGLSALAEEGLIERRPGSGTYVSDMTKSRHVGVLVDTDISDPQTPYSYRRMPQQAVRFLRHKGAAARLYAGHAPVSDAPHPLTCTEFIEACERQQLCGVIIFDAPAYPFFQWCRALTTLRRLHTPIVAERGRMGEEIDAMVYLDYGDMVRTGVEHLLRQGRRRIALLEYELLGDVAGPRKRRDVVLESFHAAMAAAGVAVNPRWIRRDLHPCAAGAGWEEFREIWVGGEEKPDGLLICDDNLFPGAAMAILQIGLRVPEDLLVVTHWNKGAGMRLPFPVVKLEADVDAHARGMAATLLKLMHGERPENRRVALSCQLREPSEGEQLTDKRASGIVSTPIHRDERARPTGDVAGEAIVADSGDPGRHDNDIHRRDAEHAEVTTD
jgi:DNA-binding LacI/PurR family transcriptional regulator